MSRFAKCHGYGGDIRVQMLGGWGKKSGKTHSFAKSSSVLGIIEHLIFGLEDLLRVKDLTFCNSDEALFLDQWPSLVCFDENYP